jgi:diketogulonate reductase-like aldo/keto reductase
MTKHFALKPEITIPSIGLGTWCLNDEKAIYSAIRKNGYRMIDCASFYKNEEIVGNALTKVFDEKSIQKSDLFVISKVWPTEVNNVEAALQRSLKKLRIDNLDLYLVHWSFCC